MPIAETVHVQRLGDGGFPVTIVRIGCMRTRKGTDDQVVKRTLMIHHSRHNACCCFGTNRVLAWLYGFRAVAWLAGTDTQTMDDAAEWQAFLASYTHIREHVVY